MERTGGPGSHRRAMARHDSSDGPAAAPSAPTVRRRARRRGHALIRNLREDFSTWTAAVPRYLRLRTAWQQLAQAGYA